MTDPAIPHAKTAWESVFQAASPEDEAKFGQAFEDGQIDFGEGCDEMDNPYEDADGRAAWQVGWETAKEDAAADACQPMPPSRGERA